MAFSYGTYTFNTLGSADESDWTFTDPLGTGVQVEDTYRRWCWHDLDTASVNIGPTSGEGGSPDGYLYPEASSIGAFNDEFFMELNDILDASSNHILIEFYTNQRGDDNDTTCDVETNENGTGWISRAQFGGSGDINKVGTSGSQIWASRSVDLTGIISHASTKIRLRVQFPSSGTTWHNDYGIDTVTITGTTIPKNRYQMII